MQFLQTHRLQILHYTLGIEVPLRIFLNNYIDILHWESWCKCVRREAIDCSAREAITGFFIAMIMNRDRSVICPSIDIQILNLLHHRQTVVDIRILVLNSYCGMN